MLLTNYISPLVPVLSPEDTGDKAMALMEDCRLQQLPVVSKGKYVCLVKESELLDWDKPGSPLKEAPFLSYRPAVLESVHPLEVIKLMEEQHLVIVPVMDEENNYQGAVTHEDLYRYISENSSSVIAGGIIILEIKPNSYSLSEIARICENESVIILFTQLHTNPVTGMLELTIKTNSADLSAVRASFERYNYTILDIYGIQADEGYLLDRYKMLMNFISM